MVIESEQTSGRVLPKPEVLRRNVADQLERLSDDGVAVLYDLAQELELRAAWADFSEGMATDCSTGKYEHLDEALENARNALRASHYE